ncbi:MAG: S9 family peptidase, partial [Lachnospiraceae bacterium]|nr:S9 family peptidase [Lachnospiraceae bacterium]
VGVMGESAGGYLAAMAALAEDRAFDVGAFTEFSSKVQAACPWYPPADVTGFSYPSPVEAAASMESMLLGKNVMLNREEALKICPVSFVTKEAPPFLIIHGNNDHTVPFSQGEILHDRLEEAGADVKLLVLEGADHADMPFFQEELWQRIIAFFQDKLGAARPKGNEKEKGKE